MPMLNITIDDASPLITYDGVWSQSVASEAHADGYTNTTWQNASATFQFWGTWIMVKGSKNNFHANYTVDLNGTPYHLNGAASSDEWQTPIFTSGPLIEGLHTVKISNDDWWTLDIDSIIWTCDVGGPNATNSSLQTNTVDDTESDFSWFPPGSWSTNLSSLTMFSQGTGHSTSQLNAAVNYTFSGDAVAIYGSVGPGHSRYSVQAPNRPPQEFDAARDILSSQVLLYFGAGFGPGNNTVTLVNESPGLFQVDYAVVHAALSSSVEGNTRSISSSSSSTRPISSSTGTPMIPSVPTTSSGPSPGDIVAVTFTALLVVFLIAALVFLLQRNKTLWYRLQRGYKVQSQFDIGTPPHGSVTPLPFSAAPQMRSKANLQPNNDDDFEAQPLNRAFTTESRLTASTLVAEPSSTGRPFSLKALRLASRWASGTPSSSQVNFSRPPSMRHSAPSTRRLTFSPPTPHLHLSRSPSVRHLLQEESQYYDPHAAAVAGLEEVPEDGIEEILRHPIRRNEPSMSTDQHWQSALP